MPQHPAALALSILGRDLKRAKTFYTVRLKSHKPNMKRRFLQFDKWTRIASCHMWKYSQLFPTRRLASSLSAKEAGEKAHRIASRRQDNNKYSHELSMDTVMSHAGILHDSCNAPMAPPLHFATTYTRPPGSEYAVNDSIYIRHDNPTRLLLESQMGQLECYGKDITDGTATIVSCAFSSGMMAISGIILAHRAPLTVLLPQDTYHGVPTVLADVFSRFGVTTKKVDMANVESLALELAGLSPDHDVLVWMESPSNPQCHIIDIDAVCQVTKFHRPDATTVVDSTLAPPPIQQALLLGADVVLHSATKYLAGHSDALIGVVTASPWTERGVQIGASLKNVLVSTGGVASSMDSWLTLRGIRTLGLRVTKQSKTALQIAEYLEKHESVMKVHYPGLPNHPGHAVAKRQMKGGLFGGVLSLELESEVKATAFAAALVTIQRATSLGGTETLIEHRASIEPEGRVVSPPGLLRISVGLEDSSDLLADVSKALEIAEEAIKSS